MVNFNDLSVQDVYFTFDSLTKLYFGSILCRMATAEQIGLVVFIFLRQEQLIFNWNIPDIQNFSLRKITEILK